MRKKYVIREREIHIQKHVVEANSKKEAYEKYVEEHCACDCCDIHTLIFKESMEVDIEHDIEEIERAK